MITKTSRIGGVTYTLTFDREAHAYSLNGFPIPSNTDILQWAGFCDYSGVPNGTRQIALEIGTDVAAATELHDRKRPWKAKYGHVEAYVDAWRRFRKDYDFKPMLIEEPLFDPLYKIATTPDRAGSSKVGPAVVQVKTGRPQPWIGIQLAFEGHCVAPRIKTACRRFSVELRPDGQYQEKEYVDPTDLHVFISAVTCYQWHKKHNPGRMKLWQPNKSHR